MEGTKESQANYQADEGCSVKILSLYFPVGMISKRKSEVKLWSIVPEIWNMSAFLMSTSVVTLQITIRNKRLNF